MEEEKLREGHAIFLSLELALFNTLYWLKQAKPLPWRVNIKGMEMEVAILLC
jgi:hypothetical protein